MKIQRFNEGHVDYDRDSMWSNQPDFVKIGNISTKTLRYLKDINYGKNVDPINWVNDLFEESNLDYKDKDIPEIIELKKLENLKKYIKNREKLNKLYEQIEDLKPSLNMTYTLGVNEFVYTVQKDLLLTDFENFYALFINGWDPGEYDIHPDIYRKYHATIAENIEILKNTNKYNL